MGGGLMLSRVASNLYWMSRYVERAENTARVLDVTWRMSLLTRDPALQDQEWFAPLNITGSLFPFSGRHHRVDARQVLHFLALDPDNPSSIHACARQARENARAVRGSITSEMWEVLNATWLEMQQMDEEKMQARGVSAFFDWVKERSHLFRGVTFGTMLRDDGYDFARLGTHVERADSTARILDVKYHVLLPSVKDVGGAVDYYQWSAVLRSVSAFESYRKVFRDVITPLKLAELLILRAEMPRSLHFCLKQVADTLGRVQNAHSAETERLAADMLTQLWDITIYEIFAHGLHEYLTDFLESMQTLSTGIQRSFFASNVPE
jgi:uncharacterized alpha-E superfamily protein